MSLLNNSNAIPTAGGDYNLENSLRFRNDASARLIRSPSTSSNRRTWTWSAWVKRGKIGTGTGTNLTSFYSVQNGLSRDIFRFYLDKMEISFNNGTSGNLITTQLFRDISSWYHIVVAVDTTNATANNRMRLYINGEEVTSFTTRTNPALNYQTYTNSTLSHRYAEDYGYYADFYLTEANLIDGQQLTPSDFGDYNSDTGGWQPIKYTGTYGTNGYYLNGSTSGTTVLDESSNSNNWASNNMNLTNSTLATYDIMTDVPTLTDEDTANYPVFNPLDASVSAGLTFSDGNLKLTSSSYNSWRQCRSSMGVSSGKWYWEVELLFTRIQMIGIQNTYLSPVGNASFGGAAGQQGFTMNCNGGTLYNNGAISSYAATPNPGDIFGIALDMDAGTLTYYENGVSQGVAFTGLNTAYSGTFSPSFAAMNFSGSGLAGLNVNFGQRPFKYTPPTGHLKINTFNLPDSSIVDGSTNFNPVLYTGDGTASHAITGVGFKPDFVWYKHRNHPTAHSHNLTDVVRGVTKLLYTNSTDGQETITNSLLSFNTDGFTVGSNDAGNTNGILYVSWNWKAGGTAVSNTAGTITSSVSANPTAGFSIVTYTGTGSNKTVGHGLGVAPQMVIVKSRSNSYEWKVWQTTLPSGNHLILNNVAGLNGDSSVFTTTTPTTSVFSIGTNVATNGNGSTYVAYCFADVEGYSKFGGYTGNGSTNGTFVYTGFRPAYVMVKQTDGVGNWIIWDDARSTYNQMQLYIVANSGGGELNNVVVSIDSLSNGFKCRTADNDINGSNNKYIYMAFAENPFKNSLAR
jgi:hypothetical protein